MKFSIEKSKEILRQTPATLNNLLNNLSDEWIKNNEGGKSWSPYDIVGHLIHGEKTDWIGCIKTILDHGETKAFEPFDRFAQFKSSEGKPLEELLDTFASLRAANLKELDSLNITEDKFLLNGLHPAFGTVTLSQLISTWTVHDLGHLVQAASVMSKQYIDEVGPWKDYLPVLTR
ncbi:MAG TPA: DinB family protein [Ignavibacteriaceae bacterium]|nr:DinB family protein [Ignavibacteriaceae bacterium]